VEQSWQTAVSFENMLKKAGLQRSTYSGHYMTTCFGPLNSQPGAYHREGGTTPHLMLVLFEEPSSQLAFKALWIYSS